MHAIRQHATAVLASPRHACDSAGFDQGTHRDRNRDTERQGQGHCNRDTRDRNRDIERGEERQGQRHAYGQRHQRDGDRNTERLVQRQGESWTENRERQGQTQRRGQRHTERQEQRHKDTERQGQRHQRDRERDTEIERHCGKRTIHSFECCTSQIVHTVEPFDQTVRRFMKTQPVPLQCK